LTGADVESDCLAESFADGRSSLIAPGLFGVKLRHLEDQKMKKRFSSTDIKESPTDAADPHRTKVRELVFHPKRFENPNFRPNNIKAFREKVSFDTFQNLHKMGKSVG
jgi:hypothetical protein